MNRRFTVIALVAFALLAPALPAAALVTPTKLVGGPGEQFQPFANDTWIVWTEFDPVSPNQINVWARKFGHTNKIKVNASGTDAWSGNLVPGTNKVVYQQIGTSDAGTFFFDLDTKRRTKVPGVNSPAWEWQPRVSKSFALFNRNRKVHGVVYTDLLLYNRVSGGTRRLGRWRHDVTYGPITGGVGELFATWTVCPSASGTCYAYIYNVDTKVTRKIPTRNGRPQYAAAVDESTGAVYFVRSGKPCGALVNVWRLSLDDLGGTPTKVVDLPDGIDTDYMGSLRLNPDTGGVDYLFERYECARNTGDVYVAKGVDAA